MFLEEIVDIRIHLVPASNLFFSAKNHLIISLLFLSIYPRFCEVNKELVEIEESLKEKEEAFDEAIRSHRRLQNDLKDHPPTIRLEQKKKIQNHEEQLPKTEEEIRLLKRDHREPCSRLRDIAEHVEVEGEVSTIIISDVHRYKFLMEYLKEMDIELDAKSDDMIQIVKFISKSLE
ncbi:hypothetical protein CCACVL1_22211 [Corchorus capsularis]|uniref:Uncharacterized protein n=1 Tax=Corchorus capsularis TaxID=210143 RepID=A0A1R3H0V2_COCAP|nr:hypothetical protein CCACVL1_22211 [Corchorus capsularis]